MRVVLTKSNDFQEHLCRFRILRGRAPEATCLKPKSVRYVYILL